MACRRNWQSRLQLDNKSGISVLRLLCLSTRLRVLGVLYRRRHVYKVTAVLCSRPPETRHVEPMVAWTVGGLTPISVFCSPSVSGVNVTCTPTAVCLTRGSWAVSANTTPQAPTAAAVRGTTTDGPGAWAPTSPSPKELQTFVSIYLRSSLPHWVSLCAGDILASAPCF